MLDEGVANIPTIDAAACEAFGLSMGPYKLINVSGVFLAHHAAVSLTESIGAFYTPATHLRELYESGELWDLSGEVDPARKQAVKDRLLAVVCGVAARVVEEGVATVEDMDRGATIGLRWAKGPFAIMNDLGLKRALGAHGAPRGQASGLHSRAAQEASERAASPGLCATCACPLTARLPTSR